MFIVSDGKKAAHSSRSAMFIFPFAQRCDRDRFDSDVGSAKVIGTVSIKFKIKEREIRTIPLLAVATLVTPLLL